MKSPVESTLDERIGSILEKYLTWYQEARDSGDPSLFLFPAECASNELRSLYPLIDVNLRFGVIEQDEADRMYSLISWARSQFGLTGA